MTHLSAGSFYNISGAMGALEDQLNAVAGSYQPLMLLGESGMRLRSSSSWRSSGRSFTE